jgi:hypothetical protein
MITERRQTLQPASAGGCISWRILETKTITSICKKEFKMEENESEKEIVLDEGKEDKLEEKKSEIVECRYCGDGKEHPERVAHMVLIETADGHIHVHAPFQDRRVMYRFLDAIEEELTRNKRAVEAGPAKTEDLIK